RQQNPRGGGVVPPSNRKKFLKTSKNLGPVTERTIFSSPERPPGLSSTARGAIQRLPGRPRQMHRPPESDCPRRSSLQGTPETTSPARDRSPQQSASSDPSANRVGIIQRESNNQVRFHTWGNSGFSHTQARGISSRVNEARLTGFAVMESCNG